jgi:hypothetical protein
MTYSISIEFGAFAGLHLAVFSRARARQTRQMNPLLPPANRPKSF